MLVINERSIHTAASSDQRSCNPRAACSRHGGDGAYGRLYRAEGTMEERLTAAAGVVVPGDSLIASWRAVLVDSAGHPTAVSWPLGLAAVFWAMAFSAMALRSTRWR